MSLDGEQRVWGGSAPKDADEYLAVGESAREGTKSPEAPGLYDLRREGSDIVLNGRERTAVLEREDDDGCRKIGEAHEFVRDFTKKWRRALCDAAMPPPHPPTTRLNTPSMTRSTLPLSAEARAAL